MLKAKDIMTRDPVSVTPETDIADAARLLLEKKINGVPVVNDRGVLEGIITQSDLIALQKKFSLPSVFTLLDGFIPLMSRDKLEKEVGKMTAATVGQAMTTKVTTVDPQTSLEDIATLMVDKKFHTLPVVEDGKLVGVVGKEDVLRTVMSGG